MRWTVEVDAMALSSELRLSLSLSQLGYDLGPASFGSFLLRDFATVSDDLRRNCAVVIYSLALYVHVRPADVQFLHGRVPSPMHLTLRL